MIESLNENYWTQRYENNQIGWDIGHVSTPIKNYIDQLSDKEIKILIPGAGNAYEAEYLWNQGFKNVWVIDLSKAPLDNLQSRIPDFPSSQLIHGNFFNHEAQYDLIIEQTFFCALNPTMRLDYVTKMHKVLLDEGKLVGLMFKVPLNTTHPPFGGKEGEYRSIFSPHFKIEIMEEAYNSIPPRSGNELFVKMIKA
ncbi:methyltransferase domain-containing protein [Roseivirga sp.]|uniref:methyltransferase domain-containing protein n=1 Tax=Roseivirga sp. TaxID=1964215 RepID=UPI002B268659|nr:methyltransferase domain-containing protein [Roseivirga sp.]